MKKSVQLAGVAALGACLVSSGVFAAVPALVEESVTLTQDSRSQQVTVSYELAGAPGIVTVDFTTNGVSIGARHIHSLAGEVNKLVQPGVHRVYWRPAVSWPNHTVGSSGIQAKVTVWSTNAPPDYLVIDLTAGPDDQTVPFSERVRYYPCAEAIDLPGGIEGELCKTDYLVMRKIPAAGRTFVMGSAQNRADGYACERASSSTASAVPHVVQLTNDYYIGVYEFTQRQWAHLSASGSARFTAEGACRPIENIGGVRIRGYMNSKSDSAQKIWPRDGHQVTAKYGSAYTGLRQLRRIAGGLPLDLPTEAQWAFAARAGKGGEMPDGSPVFDAAAMGAFGRFSNSPDLPAGETVTAETPPARGGTAIVGSYPPNAWGLYDMFGNVMEMCLDVWQTSAYYNPAQLSVHPLGPYETGDDLRFHVVRGGHWGPNGVWNVAGRSFVNINHINGEANTAYMGFRVCLTLP